MNPNYQFALLKTIGTTLFTSQKSKLLKSITKIITKAITKTIRTTLLIINYYAYYHTFNY